MLNNAQQFYNDIINPFKVADYKAPHAPRGTLAKLHWKRGEVIEKDGRTFLRITRKLFRGHRP
jgi:hypothetical protein